MFGAKRIIVCDVTKSGITATIFSKTAKGLVVEKKVENTSFQELHTEFGVKQVRLLLSEQGPIDQILKAASDAGLIVESHESASVAMARVASQVHEPFLLVYPQVVPEFVCAICDGNVLEVSRVDPLGSLEDTKRAFIEHLTKTQGITVRAIATNIPDPVVGLAMKKDSGKFEKNKPPIPLILGIVLALFLAIGFFSIRLWKSSLTVSSQIVITPTPTVVPIDRIKLKIEVQNGSGEAGLAGKGKKVLEDARYTKVATANADNYDYTGVTVKGKTAAISAFVIADIKSSYPQATASSTLLDSASLLDAIVILGKE